MSLHRRERRAKSVSSSEDEDGKASNLVEKLLKGGLLKSIEKVVEQQTALVLSKHLDGRPNDVEQSIGGSTETVDENMDPFDPDNKDMNVEQWLAKIDRLSAIQGWSEYETTCFMQMKLKGDARSWFKQNCNYDLSWPEWKKFLIQSFPPQYDFADLLTELLARKKLLDESMAYYFEVKFALCERCGFDGEKAVSLLIHGLPADVAVMARAANCKTPQELYSLLIAELDEYDTGSSSSKRPNTSFTSAEKTPVELDEYETESPTIQRQSVSYSSTTKTKMARYDEYESESSSSKKHSMSYASMEKRTEEQDEYETKSPTCKRQSVSYASTSKTKMARLEYEIEPSSHKRRSRTKSEDEDLVKRSSSRERVLQRCYNCQEMTTHYSRNCPKPRVERCNLCKHMGHLAFRCPRDKERRSEHPRRHHHRSKVRLTSKIDQSM